MKTKTFLLIGLLIGINSFGVSWEGIGPDSADISKICFGIAVQKHVLCADHGFYLYDYGSNTCDHFDYGQLPINDAAYYSPEKILIAMGDGSWSDGIYTFSLGTHEFQVKAWLIVPAFLHFHQSTDTYWAGSEWGGMIRSGDGDYWDTIPYFNGVECACIDSYGDHLAVTDMDGHVHYSSDGGNTWTMSADYNFYRQLRFDSWGKLCGVFPGTSYSSGLYQSEDFGETWEVMFWSCNLSAVGFDCFGDVFVGWEDGQGLAKFDPEAPPPGFTFLNDGLPNLMINNIQLNPTMSAPAIFVCTEGGAYFSLDYMVGVKKPLAENQKMHVGPNPAKDKLFIQSEIPFSSVTVYSVTGELIYEQHFEGVKRCEIAVASFPAGIYLCGVKSAGEITVKKIIIE